MIYNDGMVKEKICLLSILVIGNIVLRFNQFNLNMVIDQL